MASAIVGTILAVVEAATEIAAEAGVASEIIDTVTEGVEIANTAKKAYDTVDTTISTITKLADGEPANKKPKLQDNENTPAKRKAEDEGEHINKRVKRQISYENQPEEQKNSEQKEYTTEELDELPWEEEEEGITAIHGGGMNPASSTGQNLGICPRKKRKLGNGSNLQDVAGTETLSFEKALYDLETPLSIEEDDQIHLLAQKFVDSKGNVIDMSNIDEIAQDQSVEDWIEWLTQPKLDAISFMGGTEVTGSGIETTSSPNSDKTLDSDAYEEYHEFSGFGSDNAFGKGLGGIGSIPIRRIITDSHNYKHSYAKEIAGMYRRCALTRIRYELSEWYSHSVAASGQNQISGLSPDQLTIQNVEGHYVGEKKAWLINQTRRGDIANLRTLSRPVFEVRLGKKFLAQDYNPPEVQTGWVGGTYAQEVSLNPNWHSTNLMTTNLESKNYFPKVGWSMLPDKSQVLNVRDCFGLFADRNNKESDETMQMWDAMSWDRIGLDECIGTFKHIQRTTTGSALTSNKLMTEGGPPSDGIDIDGLMLKDINRPKMGASGKTNQLTARPILYIGRKAPENAAVQFIRYRLKMYVDFTFKDRRDVKDINDTIVYNKINNPFIGVAYPATFEGDNRWVQTNAVQLNRDRITDIQRNAWSGAIIAIDDGETQTAPSSDQPAKRSPRTPENKPTGTPENKPTSSHKNKDGEPDTVNSPARVRDDSPGVEGAD